MLTYICLFLFFLLLLTRSFTISIAEITATTEAILELLLKILGWIIFIRISIPICLLGFVGGRDSCSFPTHQQRSITSLSSKSNYCTL